MMLIPPHVEGNLICRRTLRTHVREPSAVRRPDVIETCEGAPVAGTITLTAIRTSSGSLTKQRLSRSRF